MRKILTSFAVVAGLVLSTAAVAQGTGSLAAGQGGPGSSGMSQGNGVTGAGSGGTSGAAPIGHRQPRAGEVPEEKNDINAIDSRDAALDRALRSICRGC
jgi:hypothetical protein